MDKNHAKKRDKILFKRYQYRGGSEYVDIIIAMEEYANWRIEQYIKLCATTSPKSAS